MTTKEQERKALAQIRKIVDSLGKDSYIATAFEGCFEIAAENIENDFACSMAQRVEAAESEIVTLRDKLTETSRLLECRTEMLNKANEQLTAETNSLNEYIAKLRGRLLSDDDICDIVALIDDDIYTAEQSMKSSAETIVQLAEHPADIAFQNAVRINRSMKSKIEYGQALKQRIEKARAGQ